MDYGHDVFPDGNFIRAFLYTKRKSFEHEQELRAVIQAIYPGSDPVAGCDPYADGLLVEIDLRMLIQCIYVAPTSETWFKTLIERIAKKYGLDVSIQHSDLARDPLY